MSISCVYIKDNGQETADNGAIRKEGFSSQSIIKIKNMKKEILASMAMMFAAHCVADNVPALKIKTAQVESSIQLSNIDKVQYTENEMIVKLKDGEVQTFIMDEIMSMAFDNVEISTAINAADNKSEGKETYFDMKGLPVKDANKKGVYIIKVGKETKKTAK